MQHALQRIRVRLPALLGASTTVPVEFGFLVSSQGGSGFAVAVEGGDFIAEGASALAA
ncbi:hypothetical protein [Nocardia asiatica]